MVIASTSERPAAERIKAAELACSVASGLRAAGHRVLLLFDSLTRYARALREVGLAVGEPPVRRGYPPRVFAELPEMHWPAEPPATEPTPVVVLKTETAAPPPLPSTPKKDPARGGPGRAQP